MRYQNGPDANGEELSSAFVVHDRVDLDCSKGGPSLTRQEFAEDCDINAIMARYEKTGVVSHVNQRQPLYLDLSAVPDYHTAMIQLDAAEAAFMSLPAKVRREFDNDPGKFVAYAENPDNIARMREWGLAAPEVVPDPPMKVEVVNPDPGDGGAPSAP